MIKKIAILGNGPSLRGVEFHNFKIDTIGMNAAYRYWNEINWYPTYYCCLDTVVLESHKKEIYHLIKDGRIKKFFLRNNILKTYPDLKNYKNIYFYENVKKLLPFSSRHITTGAFSVRFAIFLEYNEIYLFGIDCNYVNHINGCKINSDKTLTIKENIKNNPNYFFNNYQQKDDKYNVPNHGKKYICKCRHCKGKIFNGANLHLNTWIYLKKDINIFKKKYGNISIYNCGKNSKLKVFSQKDPIREII